MLKRVLSILAVMALLLSCLPMATYAVDDADTVIYDGNAMQPFAGRTKEAVAAKYSAARYAGATYVNNNRTTYYSVQPSLTAPYSAGATSDDTQAVMNAMTNYYRWLVGVQPMTSPSKNREDLQKGALVRNWDFNHSVSSANKPEDMDQALWNEGANVSHNILAWGYTPRGVISGWLNEGYDVRTGEWDTLGHRYAILSSSYSGIDYGFCGSIAIGVVTASGNPWGTNAFAAYPAPGYMPYNELYARSSAWSVQLNTSLVKCADSTGLTVRVTNLATGESYECTKGNGKLSGTSTLAFVQPDCGSAYYADGDNYQVEITGLTDVATGNAAKIVYTVNFFDVQEYADTYATGVSMGNGWSNLLLTEKNCTTQTLNMLSSVLPEEVSVQTEVGRTVRAKVAGAWTLDEENQCWYNTVDTTTLPSGVTDPKGVLSTVQVTYQVSDYTGSFFPLRSTQYAGEDGGFRLWRYMVSTDCAELYQLTGDAATGYQAAMRFDRNSDSYQGADEYGYLIWSHNWEMTDSGTWFAIYYSSDSYFNDAYLAGICTVDVTCKHTQTHTVTVDPTCSEAGSVSTICDLCGVVVSVTPIDKLPHTWGKGVRTAEPDCTNPGSTLYTCTVCSETKTEPISALGHAYGEWTVTKQATEDEYGEETRTCSRCNATDTRQTAKLACPSAQFVDVNPNLWYHKAIDFAVTNNLFSGIDATHFAPNGNTTRAMFVAVLWRLDGRAESNGTNPFVDVQPSDYFAKAVTWAVEKGIVAGADATHFNPKGDVTREQVAAFLYRYSRAKGYDLTACADLSAFPDAGQVEEYAKANLSWAVGAGLISGNKDTATGMVYLDPKGKATRAQVAQILMKFTQNIAE